MGIATLNLDTYKVVKLLQEKGYSEEEAEGFIKAIQEITLTGVATKQDVQDVRVELQELRIELKEDIAQLRTDMFKFLLIHSIAIIGVMVALFQFFTI